MADQIPLRIVTVSGQPFIGEFQSGDTVGVVHGGTGTSSIAGLKTALDYNLTGLDDVAVGFPVSDPLSANQILVWNGTVWVNEYNDKTEMRVRNGTASAMSKGDVIAIEDAHNANLVNVILADASQTSAMPALGVLEQDLAVGEEGIAITFGKAQGLNTSGLTEGATAYVSPTTPGGITTTKPTSGDHLIQNIGIVMRANASNGALKVTGIGRANDIPNAEITTLSGDADYIYIDDGGVWKKITPTNLGVGSGGGGSASLSGLTDTNISTPSHNEALVWTSSTGEWINASLAGGGGVTDHGLLTGLSDNDHPQYVLTTTNSALSSLVTNIETSTVDLSSYIASNETTWSTDNDTTDHTALSNIGTNTHAQIDSHIASGSVHFTEASIDHGSIAGLGDNDHPQYVLSATNNDLSTLVTSIETSTVDLSSYIAANETTWSTDNDTTDHTALSNIGTNTHAQIDSHIASGSVHFTEASIDHGSIAGLADNDHPQYVLSSTNSALSSLVTSIETSTVNLSSYIAANEAMWSSDADVSTLSGLGDTAISSPTNGQSINWNGTAWVNTTPTTGVTDHGLLTGLSDNDHPQYVLSATNQALSSLVTSVETSTVSLSSYIAANETTWSTDNDTTDHTALSNIGTNTHAQIDSHIADSTIHFTEASIDHGSIAGLADNDHPQYVLSATNNTLSSLVTSVETSTVNLSGYIAANETTWATDTDTTDHTALSNIGTNTHAQIDSHIADSTIHFTEASIDHGSIAGLGDNDHPQYVLSATNQALSSLVTNVEGSTVSLSSYIAANETTWSTDNDTTDHTALSNIGTNTHAQIDTHISDTNTSISNLTTSTVNLSGYIAANETNWATDTDTTDHTALSNIGTNTHAQIDTHISNHTTSANTWNGTYQTVFDNSGTWGTGGGTSDHGALTGLADNDHPQYVLSSTNAALSSLVTDTTDASTLFSGNIEVTGTTASHIGTIGTTDAATFGMQSTGNTSIIAPSIILSATSAYQFRKNGSTTFTDTDFPQSCRDWDSTYNTVLNSSGSWGGGGGGGVAAGITVVNTGTDNINSTGGALVPLDVTAGYPAYGSYATDFSYTPGNAYVTINTAGTYEVTFNVGYTTVTARWNGILKIYKGTGGASPSAWIGYGAGKMGYVRNSTGHNEASLIVTCLVTCSANDTIGGHVINEAANGTCTLVANETFMTIKRMS